MEKAHHAWQICLNAPIILLFKGMISIFHCSKVWFQSGLVDCQSGIWKKQFNKASFRTVTSPLGNIAGDGAFAGYTSEELVIGGGGTCTTFNNGVPSTLITSLPMVKGTSFPYVPWGNE